MQNKESTKVSQSGKNTIDRGAVVYGSYSVDYSSGAPNKSRQTRLRQIGANRRSVVQAELHRGWVMILRSCFGGDNGSCEGS
jgi:hypothetical protein